MKKMIAAALAMAMAATLFTGCSSGSTEKQTEAAGTEAAATEAATEAETEAGDSRAVTDETYNDMSADDLYAQALEEGGQVTVYATSSKMMKLEESFEEAYPGMDVEIVDLDSDEVIEKLKVEAETGNVNGDVLQVKDCQGSIYYDLMGLGYCSVYYPSDICEKIDPEILTYGYPLYSSQSFWYYNTDAYPDGQPITSWWNLLEKNDDGTQKYRILSKEIGQDDTYLSLFASFILNADEMEQAYEDLYGEPLEYTYDASSFGFEVPENNAGVEYLYRFTQLEMTFIGDGDELVQAVANSTADDPALALASAGKINNREESGYAIAWCTNLTPYTGLENTEYMYVVEGTDAPAGARLFIYYATGGADGESGGLKPFLKEGNWPVRSDVENDKNPVATVEECGAIAPDLADIYQIFPDVQDMWTYWLDENQ